MVASAIRVVHAQPRQLHRAVVVAQAGGIARGAGDAGKQAHDGDRHDGGGHQHLEQRESASSRHFVSTLSTRGKPVMGSSRTMRASAVLVGQLDARDRGHGAARHEKPGGGAFGVVRGLRGRMALDG